MSILRGKESLRKGAILKGIIRNQTMLIIKSVHEHELQYILLNVAIILVQSGL